MRIESNKWLAIIILSIFALTTIFFGLITTDTALALTDEVIDELSDDEIATLEAETGLDIEEITDADIDEILAETGGNSMLYILSGSLIVLLGTAFLWRRLSIGFRA